MSDDEDKFYDALSHATMSRQSSLASSLPSPRQSFVPSASERGSFLNTYRAEFGVQQMAGPPSELPAHDEAAEPSQASAPGGAMCTSKQEELGKMLLSDDPSLDPLEGDAMLDIARLDQGTADSVAGSMLDAPSPSDPLSSPLLQVSPDPSFGASQTVADPFAQSSPEPVLVSEAKDAWHATSAMSPLDTPDGQAVPLDTAARQDAASEPEEDGGANEIMFRTGEGDSPTRSGSKTLDDIQADQLGGLFGGLEMEDVGEPQANEGVNGSTASDKAAGSVSAVLAAEAANGSQDATSISQERLPKGHSSTSLDGETQPAKAKEDVLQPLPLSKPASTGRDLGSLNASEGGLGDASRAGTQGRNGATDAASSGGDSARTQAVVTAPSASDVAAGEARDTGAALQQFAAMLSSKKRHYFMVSNGGFPIYTRHGRPHDTASIAALLYSIVSLSLDALGEIPHTFTAGELTVCVRARRVRPDPYATPTRPGQHPRHPYALAPAANRTLGNVAVLTASATRSDLPPAVLHVQLELLHLQLLAWTSAKYERVLMDNPALDTSAALAGTEASFEALVKRMDFAMDYVLQAVETLRMRPIVRGAAEAALQQAVVDSDGVCGVIACGHQIVATATHPQLPPSQHMHAWDLLLLLNLVTANSSYRAQLAGQQAWVPLCLPKSAPDCFHFVYVHYPSTSSPLFIALVGRSQQMFFETHSVREPLMATLESTGVLEEAKVASGAPSSHRVPPAAIPFQDRLRHLQPLLYHMTVAKRNMFVQTAFAPALSSHRVQKQAQQDCMRLHASMWGAAAVSKTHDPMPIQWRACSRWALIGVIERGEYEAYAVLDPLIHKTEAMALFNHALSYLLENPENWQASTDAKAGDGTGFWSTSNQEASWSRAILRS